MKEKEIVEKVPRSLPMIYNLKISTIEDREDLDKLTMEELYGILIAYEMRIGKYNSKKKEENFKPYKVDKKSKTNIQSKDSDAMKNYFMLKILREVLVSTKEITLKMF